MSLVTINAGIQTTTLPDPKTAKSKKYQESLNNQVPGLIAANMGNTLSEQLKAGQNKAQTQEAEDKAKADKDKADKKTKSSTDDDFKVSGPTTSQKDSVGTYWSADMVRTYFNNFTNIQLRLNETQIAKDLADDANNISGEEATSLIQDYMVNGYYKGTADIWQRRFDIVMKADIGGGQSNTGTNKVAYKDWISIIQSNYSTGSKAEEVKYMTACKQYFKNVSDEVLWALWNAWDSISSNLYYTDEATLKNNGLSEDDIKNGRWVSKDQFKSIKDMYGKLSTALTYSGTENIRFFAQLLYNWYCENPNFYSGTIVLAGDPNYRIGMVMEVQDPNTLNHMEFYIESVEHTFSFQDGYQTTVGVTRGLKNNGAQRFTHLWGKNQDFVGGLMGEGLITDLAPAVNTNVSKNNNSSSDPDSDTPSNVSGKMAKAITWGKSRIGKATYSSPANRLGPNSYDCSGFVWRCLQHGGFDVPAGAWSTVDANKWSGFKEVSAKNAKAGDIILGSTGPTLASSANQSGHMAIMVSKTKILNCTIALGKNGPCITNTKDTFGSMNLWYYRVVG